MNDAKFELFYKKFNGFIKDLGLKYSLQREYLLKVLFYCNSHLDAKGIQKKIYENYNLKITLTSVNKILAFLEEIRIVNIVKSDNKKFYELNLKTHHDHLICTKCGKIVEFTDHDIELRQSLIEDKYHFSSDFHILILYGICENCQ